MQPILIYAFAAAVLGGLESPVGAVVGGLAIGVFLNLIGQYVPADQRLRAAACRSPSPCCSSSCWSSRPGLFGRRQVRRV